MAPPIVVKILADAKEFTAEVDKAEGKLGKFSATGAKLGAGLAVGVAGIGAAAVGAGAGLFKLGESFDESFDTIRVGTGATGDALGALQNDFKEVLRGVPTTFGDASGAVADLNTRLGLTGEPLQDLSMDFIQLSKVTGTEVAGNVDRMTRVFGDWEVSSDDTSETLDKLFRASQNSGIGIDELGKSLVTVGAPMRNLGFNLDESAALLAVFNKTGVNTETVVAGLKAGVGKMAKAGEDVPETFRRVVDEITKLGPGTEATGLAIGLFGQRAGPDLADAIAGGKFAIDDMLSAITDGSETINDAEQDTRSFGEQWNLVKNRVLVKLEPIATKVFGAMGDIMASLLPKIDPMFKRMEEIANDLLPKLESAWAAVEPVIRNLMETVSDAIPSFDELTDWMERNKPIVIGVTAAIGVGLVAAFIAMAAAAWAAVAPIIVMLAPIIAIGVAIAAVTAAVVWAYQNWGWFKDAVDAVVGFLKREVWPAIKTFGAILNEMVRKFISDAQKFISWATKIGRAIFDAGKVIANAVAPIIRHIVSIGVNTVEVGLAVGRGVARVITEIGSIVQFVQGIPGKILAQVSAWASAGRSLGRSIIDGIKNGLTAAVGFAGDVARGVWTAVRNAINANVIDRLNNAIPDSLGAGPFSVSLPANPVPRLAIGGLAGGVVDVGERGRERVLLPQGSRVIPNHQIDATGSIVVNVRTNADPEMIAREVAWVIRTGAR